MNRLVSVSLTVLVLSAIVASHSTSDAQGLSGVQSLLVQENERAKIVKIVTDPVLWQKDFPSLLASLQSLSVSGENKISVFTHEAYGRRKFSPLASEALSEASELRSFMMIKPSLRASVEQTLQSTWNQPLTTVTAVSQPGREDGMMSIALTSKTNAPLELLSPNLTLTTLRQQNGEPESVTTEIIDTGGDERRPIILTLYHYGGDAFMFAVSDMSPTPEMIERAILDTAKISKAIFTSGSENKLKNKK